MSVDQLRALLETVEAAFNNKDVAALMGVYSPTELFVFDVVGPPGVYFSKDAYREALTRFFDSVSGALRHRISDLEVSVSGDVGYGRSLQHVSGIRAATGQAFDYTVRVTNVYRKTNDTWLIVQEHVSLLIDRQTFTPVLNPRLIDGQAIT